MFHPVSRRRGRIRFAALIAFACTAWPLTAAAQEGGNQFPEGNREQVRVNAKIKGVQGPILLLEGEENQQWLVKTPDRPDAVRVIGTALPNWLQRGMFVRYSAKFDVKKGTVAEPVASLTVFTPRIATRPDEAGDPLGVFLEAGLAGAELFREPPAEGNAGAGGKPAAPETQAFQVSGQVTGFRDGKLFVSAGGALVRADLAADAAIAVDVTGLPWFQIADAVEVEGWVYPQRKTHVVANRITVRPAKPLGFVEPTEEGTGTEKPKVTPGKPTPGKPTATKKDEKAEDEKLPF